MGLSKQGFTIFDGDDTTIIVHNDRVSSNHKKKHSTSNSFVSDGDQVGLGGRENVLITVHGLLQDVLGGDSADDQKAYLLELMELNTPIYIVCSLENEDNTYSGFTHDYSGVKYMEMIILEFNPSIEAGQTSIGIELKLEEVV